MRLPLIAVALLATTGCVSQIAEGRVRSALVDGGLSDSHAACMADRMVERLSIAQLRKLESLKPRAGEPVRPVSIAGYVERVRRVGDAEVISVTASSAGLCAAGLG